MRTIGWTRRWTAALAACAAFAAAPAWPSPSWPHADPAQPLVQAPRVCMPNIVFINHRCRVVTFAPLGELEGRTWYYAFFTTHWADRHGRMDRGFPVFMYLERPTTLRLGLWVNDAPGLAGRWAQVAPPPPVLIRQPDATYLGLTLHNTGDGTPDQRLFRLAGIRWRQIKILRRSADDQAVIDAATPAGCSIGGDGLFDWTAFHVTWPLKTDLTDSPCGTLVAGLLVRGEKLALTDAHVVR